MTNSSKDTTILLYHGGLALENFIQVPLFLGCAKPKASWRNLIGYHISVSVVVVVVSEFEIFSSFLTVEGAPKSWALHISLLNSVNF